MSNLSKQRRDRMIAALDTIKKQSNEEQQRVLNDIKNELTNKKYGLIWEEHEEEVDLELTNKIPVFIEDANRKLNKKGNSKYNFLLEGDNLHSLYLLEKTHKAKIDMIYIDPPYNTGAKDWRYNNDFVADSDEFRHSKWLSFMEKRLEVAQKLLKVNGVICVTIDDYEVASLILLMDEIFGEENRLGIVTIRNNPKGRMTKRKISQVHEYAIYYGKSAESQIKKIMVDPSQKSHNYVLDENGEYYLKMNLRKQGVDSEAIKPNGEYRERYFPVYYDEIKNKISCHEEIGVAIYPIDSNGHKRIWRRDKKTIESMFSDGELFIDKVKGINQVYFRFRGGLDGEQPKSIWADSKYSASEYGTSILENILGEREKFAFPKSVHAVKQSIIVGTDNPNAIILDFFAGSGTTGEAVLSLNKDDGGNRKFILCTNNENNICEEVTYVRLKNITYGYTSIKKIKETIFEQKLTFSKLNSIDTLLKQIDLIQNKEANNYDKITKKIENNFVRLYGEIDKNNLVPAVPMNLKYMKTEWIDKNSLFLEDELCNRIYEMIELENHIEIDKEKYVILMSEKDAEQYLNHRSRYTKIQKIWFREDILFTNEQQELLGRIETKKIPRNYFDIELKEGGYYD